MGCSTPAPPKSLPARPAQRRPAPPRCAVRPTQMCTPPAAEGDRPEHGPAGAAETGSCTPSSPASPAPLVPCNPSTCTSCALCSPQPHSPCSPISTALTHSPVPSAARPPARACAVWVAETHRSEQGICQLTTLTDKDCWGSAHPGAPSPSTDTFFSQGSVKVDPQAGLVPMGNFGVRDEAGGSFRTVTPLLQDIGNGVGVAHASAHCGEPAHLCH